MANTPSLSLHPIPATAGIGLRGVHYQDIAFASERVDISWLEVHTENFFAEGGIAHAVLQAVCARYPVSFHGVGLSLGSAGAIDQEHLKRFKMLVDRYNPGLLSEHLSWSRIGDRVMNDLLPLPYSYESLQTVSEHIQQVQDYLGRQILIENPSTYLQFKNNEMTEYAFLREVVIRTGCGILLDVNNLYVTHKNHAIDPDAYLDHIPSKSVREIHLAGHTVEIIEHQPLWIDHHGDVVCQDVWNLYEKTLKKFGPIPTLIEWDTDVPSLKVLIGEAKKAQILLDRCAKPLPVLLS